MKRIFYRLGAAACFLFTANCCHNAEAQGGTCVIIGGALRTNNAAVFQRMILAGGGEKRCRFVVLPSASGSVRGAQHFARTLQDYGVPAEQIAIVDIRLENAEHSAFDPRNVAAIRRATIAYFAGGDQERILLALRKADGSDTPALAAIKAMFAHGGAVAGSSAGAAVQGQTMIAVAGLGDSQLDEGMDALDFGLTTDPSRRGLLVAEGLGFFRGGIVDQHFNQSRGRLGRLARAAAEKKVRFGFGIDENTAMIVGPDGAIEVAGTGCVTIVDARAAVCGDATLGCRIHGLRLSCIEAGDRFDPKTGAIAPNPAKKLSAPDRDADEDWSTNNHLITDIDAVGAVHYALFSGLCRNVSDKQVGVALRYSRSFAHGYCFTFRKLKTTQVWAGRVENTEGLALGDVALDIEPVLGTLRSPDTALPVDLPPKASAACRAVWFRGLLLADESGHFRPEAPLSRADLASAIVQAVHLDAPAHEIHPSDVPETAAYNDDVGDVLAAKIMELDSRGRFRPDAPVARQDAVQALARAQDFAARNTDARWSLHGVRTPCATTGADAARPITRSEAALALARMTGLLP